jgi:alpha-L-fucosidase
MIRFTAFATSLLVFARLAAQPFVHEVPRDPADNAEAVLRKSASVVPSPRQLAFHQLEFTCFIHFGPNTFTGAEWGNGKEDPAVFDPGETLDTDQWCRVAKDAGMRMMLITVKHHEGFCIWQTRYNDRFSVRGIPWRGGKGDVLRELAESCRKHGLKLGVYLSPADLYQIESSDGLYGNGSAYTDSVIPTDPAYARCNRSFTPRIRRFR